MDKIKTIKKVGAIVVSIGVGAIINNAVKATTPSTAGLVVKGCIVVGAYVLGSMVAKKAITHMEGEVDSIVKEVKKFVEEPAAV